MNSRVRCYPYIAIGIVCLGIGLRVVGLAKGIWLDEFYAIDIAVSDSFIQALRTHDYPPTYFFFLKLWSSLHTSIPFLRVPSVLFGVMTVVVVMAWLRPCSPSASLLGGFLIATAPILLRYSQEIQAYPLLLLSLACSFLCAHRIATGRGSKFWYVSLTVALSVVVTTHMIGIMLLVSIFIYLILTLMRRRHALLWPGLLPALFIPLAAFGLVFLLLSDLGKAGGWWMPALSIDLMISSFRYVLGTPSLFAPASVLSAYRPMLALAYDVVVKVCLVLCLGCLVFFGDWRRTWVLLAAAAVYWIQLIAFSLTVLPVFWYRTIMPSTIPLMSFAGLQASGISRRKLKLLTVTGLILIGLLSATGWLVTEARTPREPWKQVGQYLQSEYQQGTIVAFYPPYIEGATRFYFPSLLDKDVILIDLGADKEAMDSELTRRANVSGEKGSPLVLFLVVRPDLSVEADNLTYTSLLNYLESSAMHVYPPQKFDGLVVLKYDLHR